MGALWWAVTLLFTPKFWLLLFIAFNLPAYLIHQLLLGCFFKDRDLKRRYNAKWGLVTGASSGRYEDCFCQLHPLPAMLVRALHCLAGIGKALAKRLADQGVNVILVAKPDSLLDDTHAEMQSTYKHLQVRKASTNQGHRILVI